MLRVNLNNLIMFLQLCIAREKLNDKQHSCLYQCANYSSKSKKSDDKVSACR